MKSCVISAYGTPFNLEFRDLPRPEPAAGQVLVEVHAVGLNPVDALIASGRFKRLLPYETPLVLGQELAGEVVGVGAGVTEFVPGR